MTSLHRSDGSPHPDELGTVLGRLSAAGTRWFAVLPAAAVVAGLPDRWRAETTIIDVTDLRDPPLTVNPFEPEPGCAVQAHADRLAALFEAAFRPPAPVRTAVRLALRRAYADCGWDLAGGAALPGAAGPPGIPSLGDLRRAALRVAAELGVDAGQRAAIRGFFDVQLGSLWHGPAGQFLASGHPADMPGLLSRNVIFTAGYVADPEAAAFLAGVPLIRVAERLRVLARDGLPGGGRPGAVVTAVPAGRLRRLLDEIRGYGTEVSCAGYTPATEPRPAADTPDPADPADPAGAAGAAGDGAGTRPVPRLNDAPVALRGRRSAACGLQCRQRPCSGYELHEAGLLAGADGQVWLRLWVEALVLAFLTGRPLPQVPAAVRRTWPSFGARTRECLLATIIQAAVASRALALRYSYDPMSLTAVAATTAAGLLSAATAASAGPARLPERARRLPPRAGQVWVIPQLRWLHEAERLSPLGQAQVRREDIAPPLDFELAGLPDWPGIRVGDRLDGLRRHRLSMDSERNRRIAASALLGAGRGGPVAAAGLDADLAIAGIGLRRQQRLHYAARVLGAGQRSPDPGWLEVVLSWPARWIHPAGPPEAAGETTVPEAATG